MAAVWTGGGVCGMWLAIAYQFGDTDTEYGGHLLK